MARIEIKDLDYVETIDNSELASVYGGFNWSNFFSNLFNMIPLNVSGNYNGWGYSFTANGNGIGFGLNYGGFNFGFTYHW